jgi:hypothetical protein
MHRRILRASARMFSCDRTVAVRNERPKRVTAHANASLPEGSFLAFDPPGGRVQLLR